MTQVLQLATAINNFIVGCKADGIWDPIKACCIMGGWDGLSGALYPLKGAAPTNFNFVSGDYDRKTGLVGNGSTKYLDSNRQNAAEPQNSRHQAVFVSTGPSIAGVAAYIAGGGLGYTGVLNTSDTPSGLVCYASNDVTGVFVSAQGGTTGFKGVVRNSSTQASVRSGGSTTSASNTSAAENTSRDVAVFAQVYNLVNYHSSARLAFYSIGEALDLALLDARVTALMNAISAAVQDPSYANVSLLLHGNGANGSTTITDNSPSPKTVTAVGNAQISTAQSRFGGASMLFDGTGDYLTVPNSAAWDFGTGDFTIEAWIYIAANTPPDGGGTRNASIVSNYPASTLNVPCYALAITGDATTTGTGIVFTNRDASAGYSVFASITLAKNTWYHVAVARSGATTRLFVDGSLLSSGTLGNQTVTSVNPLLVGRLGFTGYQQELNGHIDDLRITKGVARYTANFIPPAAPFSDS